MRDIYISAPLPARRLVGRYRKLIEETGNARVVSHWDERDEKNEAAIYASDVDELFQASTVLTLLGIPGSTGGSAFENGLAVGLNLERIAIGQRESFQTLFLVEGDVRLFEDGFDFITWLQGEE